MAGSSTKRRSIRQQAGRKQQLAEKRKRSIYYEPDSDELAAEESEEVSEDGEADFQPQPARKRRRTKPQTRAVAQTRRQIMDNARSKRASKKDGKKHKKIQLAAPLKSRTRAKDNRFAGPSDGKTPKWTSLPIDILRDVFTFASRPIHGQTPTARDNAIWLIRAARTCRAFATPALEAYYQAPYAYNNAQPHYLLELLQMPNDKTYLNYAVKVKALELDIKRLAYTAMGKFFDLSAVVRLLPQLQHMEIVHPQHDPPYRRYQIQKWTYPTDLFRAMDEASIRLKTWRWDRSMIPESADTDVHTFMQLAHTSKAFDSVGKLTLCGFGTEENIEPQLSRSDDEPAPVPKLAALLSQLQHLKDITFISCDAVVDNFLEHLPANLERLQFSNCLELTSDMLRSFLRARGAHLRELVLNHNSAVDLTFLTELRILCPKLELLKVDLTYYSERFNYNDAWPMYKELLSDSDIPTWPSSLQHLEIINMQKCTQEASQNLFRSLVEGARDLRDLRHLVIHAHISIPWRDRAQFRDQWIDRLNKVYLRKINPPSPFMGSLRQYRLYKNAIAEGRTITSPDDIDPTEEPAMRRRLSHVRITPRKPPPDVPVYSDAESSPQQPRARRSTRVAERVESQNVSTAAEDESSEPEDGGEGYSEQDEAFIQGMCQVVDIRIDNQRPRENQLTEANFLDTEPSGDEDWHSGAELSDDGYAW